MDLEGHYPQNTISNCIIPYATQITLHSFQSRIYGSPEIRAGFKLFFAMSKTRMRFLTSSFFHVLQVWFPAGQGLKKLVLELF